MESLNILNFDIGGDWKFDGDKKTKERYFLNIGLFAHELIK